MNSNKARIKFSSIKRRLKEWEGNWKAPITSKSISFSIVNFPFVRIIQLEDELKNKERILKGLQEENDSLLKVQKEQEKALQALNKEGDYDKKINELNEELKKSKEHLRKLQFKQREEEKNMKN